MLGQHPTHPSIEQHRQTFSALSNKAYFNYGGQGPMSSVAMEAIFQSYRLIQEIGPFSNTVHGWLAQETQETRNAIASELGVTPDTITLTEDVTMGCNIALWGLNWQKGDRILLTDCEHPGVIAAIQEIQRRFSIEIDTCPIFATLNQGDPNSVISQHLTPQTKLLVISHLLWNTGQVLPLEQIVKTCHSRGVQVLVDAAQSVGCLPLHLAETEVDFYAFTGHKWWCGPEGLGGLYVHPQARETLHPTFIGWRGITSNPQGYPTGWLPDGRRYEVATSAYPLYAGLRKSLETHQAWGRATDRYQRICQLSARLWEQLQKIPQVTCLKTSPPEAGLISFQLQAGQHNSVVQALEQKGFCVRTLRDPDCIRACVHYLTLPQECDRLVDTLQQLLG